jgi:exonuclease VII large subunit
LQTAADELVTLQQYNQQWQQILQNATTEVQRSEAEAAIRQNAQLIQEKSQFIQTNRPRVEQFFQQRTQYVQAQLEQARQSFTDNELKNKANFTELRDKLSKEWKGAKGTFVPGVPNIDLVSSDEYILGLIRDGMKFREGPKVRNAGGSLAATRQPVAKAKTAPDNKAEELQKKAQAGDKNAARDLLATMLMANKNRRK